MNDELAGREPPRTHAPRSRRFKRIELELADGGRLILGVDGSIDHVHDHGSKTRSWTPDDPEWPDQAIRFGLHSQAPTVTPQGPRVQGPKAPRW